MNDDTGRFIESNGVPGDASVVDHIWRYVNKDGNPDRRFKINSRVPVVEYENIHLTSSTGLNELVQVSRVGAGSAFESALQSLARLIDAVDPTPFRD